MSYAASIGLALIISFILLPPNMKRNDKQIPIDRVPKQSSDNPNRIENNSPIKPSRVQNYIPTSTQKVANVYKRKTHLSNNLASSALFTDHKLDTK